MINKKGPFLGSGEASEVIVRDSDIHINKNTGVTTDILDVAKFGIR